MTQPNVWTALLNVDDVSQVTVNFFWDPAGQNQLRSETITLGGNTSTPDPLTLYIKTIDLELCSCSVNGDFRATLDMEVGTPPRSLVIP
jgi:hypothetical protein